MTYMINSLAFKYCQCLIYQCRNFQIFILDVKRHVLLANQSATRGIAIYIEDRQDAMAGGKGGKEENY
jgi:hypothetical protein